MSSQDSKLRARTPERDTPAAPPADPYARPAALQAPEPSTPPLPGPRPVNRWIPTIADAIVPLAMGVLAVLVFALLEQAQDALFGALGSPRDAGSAPFYCYLGAAAVYGNLLWYSARVLVAASTRTSATQPAHARARRHYPRLLAYLMMSLLMAVPVYLARQHRLGDGASLALAALSLLAPFVLVPLAQGRSAGGKRWARLACVATALFQLAMVLLAPPEVDGLPVRLALALGATLPTLCYAMWVRRRAWLPIGKEPAAVLSSYRRHMLGFALAGLLIFGALGFAPPSYPRALGSPAIALLSLNGFLVGLVTLTLLLRALERRRPGAVTVGALGLLAAGLLLHSVRALDPWREVPGRERVSTDARPAWDGLAAAMAAPPAAQDVVVNSYGGGLRAALYTAVFLAEMDDLSCGRFGQRLHALSGVSGGSLGIATYLVMRQRMGDAGWAGCRAGQQPPARPLGGLVEGALDRDHLSPALGRMLTRDLLPYVEPKRGQALLDSWDQAIRAAQSERFHTADERSGVLGLAMPLSALDGGIRTKPTVLFNATDAERGKIFWMSNRGAWGRDLPATEKQEKAAVQPMESTGGPLDLQLGQAVLHSARFPVVSPVGAQPTARGEAALLVDGGLSDVSGAYTLSRHLAGAVHWIDIDGNFDASSCARQQAQGLRIWSTLSALLALRVNQAYLAVQSMGSLHAIGAKLAVEDMLDAAHRDPAEYCALAARMHTAPLGWYMSLRSAEDLKRAARNAARRAAAQLDGGH